MRTQSVDAGNFLTTLIRSTVWTPTVKNWRVMKIQSTMNKQLFFQTFVARAVGLAFLHAIVQLFFLFH